MRDPAEEWSELRDLLERAWVLFGESDTIEPQHLTAEDHFDRWCIDAKAALGDETLRRLDPFARNRVKDPSPIW